MALLVYQHDAHEHTARLGETLRDHGHRLQTCALYDGDALPPDLDNIDGIISMGGPMNVDEQADHPWIEGEKALIKQAHDAGLPIVGICLGAQLIAEALGGKAGPMDEPEVGWATVKLAFPGTIDTLYGGIGWETMQFHMHGYEVKELPPGATPLAGSKQCRTQAYKVGLRTYAYQYHFEWKKADIERFAKSEFVTNAGASPEQIAAGTKQHYDDFHRLGDRLSESIATYLFPVDRR